MAISHAFQGEEESQYDRIESTYVTPPLSELDSTFADSTHDIVASSVSLNIFINGKNYDDTVSKYINNKILPKKGL